MTTAAETASKSTAAMNVDEGSEYDPEPDLEQVTKKLADLRKQRRKTNLTPKQKARLDEDIELVESHEEVLRQRAKELSHPETQSPPKKKPGRPPKKAPVAVKTKKKAPPKRKPKVVPELSESESESEEESDSEIQISPFGIKLGNSSCMAKLPNSSSGWATLRTAKPFTE